MEDLSGRRFGKWTVLERAYDNSKSKGAKWLCQCDCGTKKIVFGKNLRNGTSTSCGCSTSRNWIGERFGSLVVKDVRLDKKKTFLCQCDCGNIVEISSTSIYKTKSCGCSRLIDCTGEKYGLLTVKDVIPNMNDTGVTYALCDCECGFVNFLVKMNNLRSGNTT